MTIFPVIESFYTSLIISLGQIPTSEISGPEQSFLKRWNQADGMKGEQHQLTEIL